MTDAVVILRIFFQAANQDVQRLVFLQTQIIGLQVVMARFFPVLNENLGRGRSQQVQSYRVIGGTAQQNIAGKIFLIQCRRRNSFRRSGY